MSAMTTPLPLPGEEEVTVVGAVTSLEEAAQTSQMAFVLAWALRAGTLARPQRAGPSTAVPPM